MSGYTECPNCVKDRMIVPLRVEIAGLASKINQDGNFTLKFDEIEQISEQSQPIKTWFFGSRDMCLEITYS